MTPAQARAALRSAQQKHKQAISKYNREVNRYNAGVKRAVSDYNREVRAYNAKARAHNAQVENQRRRLNQEIRRLQYRPAATTFVTYRTSMITLTQSYSAADARLAESNLSPAGRELINRGSDEAANSVYLLNAMDGDGAPEDDPTEDELRSPTMQAELAAFGQDVVDRWTGALFSLSPQNPDAARHFCTSSREVLIAILDHEAPDAVVIAADPHCQRTDRGEPTRRAKIRYLLGRKGIDDASIEDLVDSDVNNVLDLFAAFNKGTHGHAGRFTITQLYAIRVRVESAIGFIHALVSSA